MLFQKQVAHQSHVDRIEPGERLVKDQQVRLVQNRRQKLNLLLHALGELFTPLLLAVSQAHAFEPVPDPAVEPRPGVQALEPRHVAQERPDAHLAVDPPLLGQIADAVLGVGSGRPPKNRQLAGVGEEDRHDHADGGGLAGAVGPDEPVQRPGGDREVEIPDGACASKGLVDAAHENRVLHRAVALRGGRDDTPGGVGGDCRARTAIVWR